MAKKKTKKPLDKTQISISLPTKLVDRIDKLAGEQNRNRSNFISNSLTEIMEKHK